MEDGLYINIKNWSPSWIPARLYAYKSESRRVQHGLPNLLIKCKINMVQQALTPGRTYINDTAENLDEGFYHPINI